ncbi:hypothetical protein [Embleya hyalina]|uniref:Uncharacterized protein n=1 Tax=Embleya hyalina TaxID=516124 RepID=A0A401Z3X7_9ACTN|nr:hypothetical protein [Embleya hyalina]GCE01550.1 hypothetical protein EHYA_09316 [Embleya hyalina]
MTIRALVRLYHADLNGLRMLAGALVGVLIAVALGLFDAGDPWLWGALAGGVVGWAGLSRVAWRTHWFATGGDDGCEVCADREFEDLVGYWPAMFDAAAQAYPDSHARLFGADDADDEAYPESHARAFGTDASEAGEAR